MILRTIVFVGLLVATSVSAAEEVTIEFSGHLTGVGGDLSATFSVPQEFTGIFSYDTDSPFVVVRGDGDSATRGYLENPVIALGIEVDSYVFGTGTSSMAEVMPGTNDGDLERRLLFNVREIQGAMVSGFEPKSLYILFYFEKELVDTYLPTDLAWFDGLSRAVFFVDWADADWQNFSRITGEIDLNSLTISPDVTTVEIDIKPGSNPNCFNINGHGVVPVAVLGSEFFDVAYIDQSKLSFGGLDVRVRGNKGPMCSLDDVNLDGFYDLVCHFQDNPDYWAPGEEVATLTGELLDGTAIEGADSICIVP